ncbi:SRPBCC domain-containing protein [Actinocorallia lasiicapitis]
MGKEFRSERRAEVEVVPEQVWDAIATGPGIDSWFMGRTQVEDGVVETAFSGFAMTHPIEVWEPGSRLEYAGEKSPDGRFVAYEFLIEGREGASTVLRAVTSGFLPGDDWAEEFEAMGHGFALFFATLVAYLRHFPGRTALPVTASGPPVADWTAAWAALHGALGVTDPREGDRVRWSVPGVGPLDATVYHVSPHNLAVRTDQAMYRFVRGFHGSLMCMHHVFADVDPDHTQRAWTAWLNDLPR